jgi:hypothetical protein
MQAWTERPHDGPERRTEDALHEDLRLSKLRHEEILREAELDRLKNILRANRRRYASRWASTVAWEVARAAGLLRKRFMTRKDQN